MTEKIINDSIKRHVKEYFMKSKLNEIIDNIVKNLLDIDIKNQFYKEIANYKDILNNLSAFQNLRNIHIHDLGIENEEYKSLSGIYGTDNLRGLIASLVPIIDKYVNKQVNNI